jgi:hypothetical protein
MPAIMGSHILIIIGDEDRHWGHAQTLVQIAHYRVDKRWELLVLPVPCGGIFSLYLLLRIRDSVPSAKRVSKDMISLLWVSEMCDVLLIVVDGNEILAPSLEFELPSGAAIGAPSRAGRSRQNPAETIYIE